MKKGDRRSLSVAAAAALAVTADTSPQLDGEGKYNMLMCSEQRF